MGIREYDEPVKAVRRATSPGALRPRPVPRGSRRLAGLAAALLVALGGFTWGGLYQQSRIQELSAPQSVPAVVALFPEGEAVRGELSDQKTLPADTRTILILSSMAEPAAFRSHEVLIEEMAGELHWKHSGEEVDADGAITLFLPAGLPEGDYRIRTFGIEDGRTLPLESYLVSMRPGGP